MNDTLETTRLSPVTRWGRALAVHLLSMAVSIAVFAVTIGLAAAGVGTVIIWVGFPILAVTLIIAHGYAVLKRNLAVWQGAADWEDLAPLPARQGVLAPMWAVVRSPERWAELAYAIVGGLVDFILAVVAISFFFGAVAELLAPLTPWNNGLIESLASAGVIGADPQSALGHPQPSPGPLGGAAGGGAAGGEPVVVDWYVTVPVTGFWTPTIAADWLDFAIGVGLFLVGVPLVWLCSVAQIGLTRAFLAPSRRALKARLARVEQASLAAEQAREATVQAESTNLSRIERDLHDGPQQRLIRTGLDLAALERRLEVGDTEGARSLVREVRSRNDETIAEIRTLSRGFAPPVLAEQGLRQAIASLAATSPIPVSLSADLTGPRPGEAVERAVYFAVSETLANAAKHSGATQIGVSVQQSPYGLVAQVSDNGRGGAQSLPGHGLQGLADRLTAVGGRLSMASPAGQGTTVRVEVPFESSRQ